MAGGGGGQRRVSGGGGATAGVAAVGLGGSRRSREIDHHEESQPRAASQRGGQAARSGAGLLRAAQQRRFRHSSSDAAASSRRTLQDAPRRLRLFELRAPGRLWSQRMPRSDDESMQSAMWQSAVAGLAGATACQLNCSAARLACRSTLAHSTGPRSDAEPPCANSLYPPVSPEHARPWF